MKTKQTVLPFFFLTTIILFACKKNSSVDPNPPNTGTTNDSSYLAKYYYIEIDNGIADTATRITYAYDNLKRVISILDTSHEAFANPLNKSFEGTQFFYIGNDTLPYKRTSIFNLNYPNFKIINDTITTFYTFNPGAQRLKDSSVNSLFTKIFPLNQQEFSVKKIIQDYVYAANKIYSNQKNTILQNSNGNISSYIKRDTVTLDGNENITEERSRKFTTVPSINDSYYISSISYDNKPSPFSQLNIRKVETLPNFTDYNEGLTGQRASNNNILKIHQIKVPLVVGNPIYVFDNDETGHYTYKANGLPAFILSPDISSPAYFFKSVFIYKAL
jgi:hypothetical protein